MASAGENVESREIKENELTLIKHLATGGMAEVSLCRWTRNGVRSLVAKKSLLRGDITKYKIHLTQEISILVSIDHPNIVTTYGYVHSSFDFGLIMSFYKFGSYQKFFVESNYENPRDGEANELLFPLKLRILKEIISALKYLHSCRPKMILHLDIKSDNVLLDDNLHAKVSDFGLSEMKTVSRLSRQSSSKSEASVKGTLVYIAPEHLNNPRQKYTTKTDVYAFGILAWQVAADKFPYDDSLNKDVVLHHVRCGGLRPDLDLLPDNIPPDLVDFIIKKSWEQLPEDRPDYAELYEKIDVIISETEYFDDKSKIAEKYAISLLYDEDEGFRLDTETEDEMAPCGAEDTPGSDKSFVGDQEDSVPTFEKPKEKMDKDFLQLEKKFVKVASNLKTGVDAIKYLMNDKITPFKPEEQSFPKSEKDVSLDQFQGDPEQVHFIKHSAEDTEFYQAESQIPGFPQPLYERLNKGGKNVVNWFADIKNDVLETVKASNNRMRDIRHLGKEMWNYKPDGIPRRPSAHVTTTEAKSLPLNSLRDANMDAARVFRSETVPKYVIPEDIPLSELEISEESFYRHQSNDITSGVFQTESETQVLGTSSCSELVDPGLD